MCILPTTSWPHSACLQVLKDQIIPGPVLGEAGSTANFLTLWVDGH